MWWLFHVAGLLICLPLFVVTQGQAFKKRFQEHKLANFLIGLMAVVSFVFLAVEIGKALKTYWAVASASERPGPTVEQLFERGVELANSGRNADAIRVFSAVIEAEPGKVKAYVKRGRAYAALGLDDRALADFDSALGMTPGLSEVAAEQQSLIARREAEALAPLWNDIAARAATDDPVANIAE